MAAMQLKIPNPNTNVMATWSRRRRRTAWRVLMGIIRTHMSAAICMPEVAATMSDYQRDFMQWGHTVEKCSGIDTVLQAPLVP